MIAGILISMRRGRALSFVAASAVALLAWNPAPAVSHSVEIRDFQFHPQTIVVEPGEPITWTNFDVVSHTVTSDGDIFDSGSLEQGESWTLTLNQPGLYGYYCSPHPNMTGTIHVGGTAGIPSVPQNLRAVPSVIPGYVGVVWQAPADDGGSPVQRYRLCRGTAPGTYDSCIPVVGTNFADGGYGPLEKHYYTVAAVNSFGTGPPTPEACAMTGPWLELLDC